MVYCVCIDMIGSTKMGLELSTRKLDRFNQALVEQIKPHLESLELTNILIKFTGDGWLLMTDNGNKVPSICCLATIMVNRFKDDMSERTGIGTDNIPELRIAICSGRDIRVEIPDGRNDWVGDSARRAVRASKCCLQNEILIDEPVRYIVFRDFDIKAMDERRWSANKKPEKTEEKFPLRVLGELKLKEAAYSEAPEYFVYTLDVIGKAKKAKKVVKKVSERLKDEARKTGIDEEERQRILRSWNRLMSSINDYSMVLKILKSIRDSGLNPNAFTYNMLINKAPDYDITRDWVDAMLKDGIKPNVVTYNTLIKRSPDYETAKVWLDAMNKDGIENNIITYTTLISKATDYDAAKGWLDAMRKDGIEPNVVTYNTLIDKAPDYDAAKGWLDAMNKDGNAQRWHRT